MGSYQYEPEFIYIYIYYYLSRVLPAFHILKHRALDISVDTAHVKSGKSAFRFAKYRTATTVQQYRKLGGHAGDWQFDIIRGVVKFTDPTWQALVDQYVDTLPDSKLPAWRRKLRRSSTVGTAFMAFMAYTYSGIMDSVAGVVDSPAAIISNSIKANYMHVLGGAVYTETNDGSMDIAAMAAQYDNMRAHLPSTYAFGGVELNNPIEDFISLHPFWTAPL